MGGSGLAFLGSRGFRGDLVPPGMALARLLDFLAQFRGHFPHATWANHPRQKAIKKVIGFILVILSRTKNKKGLQTLTPRLGCVSILLQGKSQSQPAPLLPG